MTDKELIEDLKHKNAQLRTKNVRLINLLGDIGVQAQTDPLKLAAFNSPLLHLASIEVWDHHHPDQQTDYNVRHIYEGMRVKAYGKGS